MLLSLARRIGYPDWAPERSRFWNLDINDRFLDGEIYDVIQYPFTAETDSNGHFLRQFDRRPAVRLNIPMVTANTISRKLFGRRHVPRIVHDKEPVMKALKWLIKETKLNSNMVDVAFRGQAGSVGMFFKVVKGKPVIQHWPGKACWPEYDDADKLARMTLAYAIKGSQWIQICSQMGFAPGKDNDGNDINPSGDYWYVRVYDDLGVATMRPPVYSSWNPAQHSVEELGVVPELSPRDNMLGEPLSIFIKNLSTAGNKTDGVATFNGALDNCIGLDYGISQLQRGINACASPMLATVGRVLNYDAGGGGMVLGPSNMLQFNADRKDPNGVSLGAGSAEYVEMSGNGIDKGLALFEKIKQWTQEFIAITRKNPETVKGGMSGKAMELIDEETNDLVDVQESTYGDEGYLPAAVMMGKILIAVGHPVFQGISNEDLDECELQHQKRYTASPQEVLYLTQALSQAVVDGLADGPEAKVYYNAQIGMSETAVDISTNDLSGEKKAARPVKPTEGEDEEIVGVAKKTEPSKKTGVKPKPKSD